LVLAVALGATFFLVAFAGLAAFFAFGRWAGFEVRRRVLEAAGRRFGADALLTARLAAFFFPVRALPAGFLAI